MTAVAEMLRTHPTRSAVDENALAECISACFDCAQACSVCADACLGEQEHVSMLTRCIHLNLDCADVCDATGRFLSRLTHLETEIARPLVDACAQAARLCAEECERHAEGMNMEHCRVCAESCRRCESACQNLLGAFSG